MVDIPHGKFMRTVNRMSDLISREDIPYIDLNGDMPQSKVRVWVAFKEQIDALPSADRPTVDKEYLIDLIQESVYDGEACAKLIDMVDRPTGEWEIETDTDEYGLKRPKLVCSKCKKEPAAWDLTELFEFCPNCGAKMKGADDED